MELFSEPDQNTGKEAFKCWVNGVKIEGAVCVKSRFKQDVENYGNYSKLMFEEGEILMLVSCSIDNSYTLFGFKLDTL